MGGPWVATSRSLTRLHHHGMQQAQRCELGCTAVSLEGEHSDGALCLVDILRKYISCLAQHSSAASESGEAAARLPSTAACSVVHSVGGWNV